MIQRARVTLLPLLFLSFRVVLADTSPPRIDIEYPDPGRPYSVGGSVLPLAILWVSDDVAVQSVTWATDAGPNGPVSRICPYTHSPSFCYWEAREIPLIQGSGNVRFLARDAAGNETTAQLSIFSRGSPRTIHVDCSASASGDGSYAAPLGDLQSAIAESFAGDTIQIDRGPCAADVFVGHGLTIQGDPTRPHAELDMNGRFLSLFTPERVTLRHFRMLPPDGGAYRGGVRAESWTASTRVVVEDARDATLYAWFALPVYVVRDSDNILFYGFSSGASISVDAERSTRLAFGGACYSGGLVRIRARESEITQLEICDHGLYDIEVERSFLSAGTARLLQSREGGGYLRFAIRDSVIVDTHILFERCPFGFFQGGPCDTPRPEIVIERCRVLNSIIEYQSTNHVTAPVPALADLVMQNNILEGSSLRIALGQKSTTSEAVFAALIRHNTFVGSPAAAEIKATREDSVAPTWSAEIANNIVTGNQVGILVSSSEPGLIDTRIAGNVFHENDRDLSVDATVSTEDNILADPRLSNPASGTLGLRPGSPCIDAGVSLFQPPLLDFLGRPRSLDGDKDGVARPDIGAVEYLRGRVHRRERHAPDSP